MAKYSSSINYKITTSLDASGISKLQAELNKLEHELTVLSKRDLLGDQQVGEAINDIKRIENAINKAFSPRLGMMNTATFMKELTAGGRSLSQIYNSLGTRGTAVFAEMYGQLGKIDTGMKSVSKSADKVFNTLGNTVRWGLIASGFQYVLNGAHSAVQYMADLDKSLTNIRLVTDESKESMREFAKYANDAAKSLGSTTVAYTDAALIYAQQGYGLKDQKTLANYTLMTANATGQDTAEVSEQMTSMINGFQLSVDEVGGALDVLAKVANTSAADLEELATATSKVASTANTLGVTQEQLTAQIATIVSVTREAPENVGNALKTIYARFGDLSLGETLEDGMDLGKVSSTLEKIGVQVLDRSGEMRDMGLIMEDLMEVWGTLSTAQKQGAAVTLAGKYQYNRLMALMENSDMYEGYYEDAKNSSGTLEQMQSEYMESLEGKANALKASFEGLLTDLFNQDDFGVIIEGLTKVIDLFDSLVDAIGGGGAALSAFGAIGMNVFSNQIGRGISNIISNKEKSKQATANANAAASQAKDYLKGHGVVENANMRALMDDTANINKFAGSMSDEQIEQANNSLEKRKNLLLQLNEAETKYKEALIGLNAAFMTEDLTQERFEMGTRALLQTIEAEGVSLEKAQKKVGELGTEFTTASKNANILAAAVSNLTEDSIRTGEGLHSIHNRIDPLIPSFEKMKQHLENIGGSTDEIKKVSTALETLKQASDGDEKALRKLSTVVSQGAAVLTDYGVVLEKLGQQSLDTDQDLQKLLEQVIQTSNAFAAGRLEAQGFQQQLANQELASHVASLASGAMSLVFAFQSLQSLGAIIEDEDMEAGEKFFQILMNGTMTIAMLSMGYYEATRAIAAFKTAMSATTIIEGISVATKQLLLGACGKLGFAFDGLTVAEVKNLTVTEALELATLALIAKIKALGAAIMANPIMAAATVALAAALAAATIAVGMTAKAEQKRKEVLEENLQASNELIDSLRSQKDTLDDLYDTYEKTGEVTQEFKDTLLDTAEALGIQNAELDIAAGNYDVLKEKIDQATAAQLLYNNSLLGQENRDIAADGDFTTYTSGQRYLDVSGLSQDSIDAAGLTSTPVDVYTSDGYGGGYVATAHEYDIEENLPRIARASEKTKNEIAELNGEIATLKAGKNSLDTTAPDYEQQAAQMDEEIAAAEAQLEQAEQRQKEYDTVLTADAQQYLQNMETQKVNALDAYAQQGTFENLSSYEEVANVMKEIPEFAQEYQDIYDAEGAEAADAWLLGYATRISEGLDPAVQQEMALESARLSYIENAENEEEAIDLTNMIMDSALSDEDKISLMSLLQDSDRAGDDLSKWLGDVIRGAEVEGLDKAILNNSTEEEKKAYAENQNKAGEALAESYGIDVQDFKTYRDLLADTHPELKENAKALNEVAVANKRLQKGIEAVADDWEDYDAIMSDSSASMEDVSKVITGMQGPLQDILNLTDEEFEFLPTDFLLDNWPLVQDVMNGVEGSVDTLRDKAGESILMTVEGVVDPNGNIDAGLADLHNAIASFDATQFEVGVAINPEDQAAFYDNCQAIIDAAGMTAEQAQAYFGSMGYDVTFKKEPKTVTETVWDYTYSYEKDEEGNVLSRTVQGTPRVLEGEVEVPVIETITPNGSYGGGIGVQDTASKGSRGGGGGGGGGGGSKKAKTEKKSDAKADRYQNVNAHLDRLSGNLEKIANEQDRLAGKDAIENMEKQVELLEEQVKWHQKKLEIQQQEAAEERAELSSEYGVTFDSDGYIENYEAIYNQFKNKYDALVDQYNATTDEESQEKIKEQMDAVQEEWDAFVESIERYDELVNGEILESINTLEDLEDQMEDLRIEAFNMAVEAADNIKEVKDAWADYMGFMSGLHPDSPFRALIEDAEKYENTIENLEAKQADLEQLMQWLPQYQAGGVITTDNPFGENSAAFYEALQTAYESYIEAALAAEQLYYDQIGDIMDAYDEIVNKINRRMAEYERLTERLDHYASVIETLYGSEDYDRLLAIKRANQEVLESSITQSRQSLALLQAEYEKQKALGVLGEEELAQLRDHVISAEQELEALVEEAAQNIMDILEMEVDSAVSKWKNAMLGGDASWMETQWELAKQNAELYLDTVEETYELEKLRSKYNSLANDTMDLNLRKRINEQMEQELAYLREKDKLSEYDINYANAKLEILQKQIALEEAQANKNQMKLRRDSQGNYSYVYTANKDDVTNAQNELMDAEFNAYNMSKENYTQTYDNYLSYVSNIAEQIRQISLNTELEEDERNERIAELKKYLAEYIASISDQLTASQRGMLESVALLAEDTSGMTGETFKQISEMMQEDWTAALEAIGVATNDNFVKLMTNMESFFADTEVLWSDLEKSLKDWAERVELIADDGTEGFRDIDDIIIDISKDMKALNDETENFFGLINDDLGTIDSAIGKLADYEAQILQLKDSSSKVVAQLELARDTIEKKDNEIRDLQGQLEAERNRNNNPGDGGSNGGGGGGSSNGGNFKVGDLVGYKGSYYYDSWGASPTGNLFAGQSGAVKIDSYSSKKYGGNQSVTGDYSVHISTPSGGDLGWVKYSQLFDTGGYTGSWSNGFDGAKNGKLAFLHQKELVLNANDTENVLAAVSMVRDVIAAMKGDSVKSLLSIGNAANIARNDIGNLQQNIEIYADFPAAESAAEIKSALEGLAQQAVQYSKRIR